MKNIILLAILSILLFANQVNTEDLNISTKDLNTTVEDINLSALSEDELIVELMKLEEDVEEEKAKTIALKKKSEDIRKLGKTVDKLEQTVNELSEHLNISE